jgi:hypothetical protein
VLLSAVEEHCIQNILVSGSNPVSNVILQIQYLLAKLVFYWQPSCCSVKIFGERGHYITVNINTPPPFIYISLPPGTGTMRNRFAERNFGQLPCFSYGATKKRALFLKNYKKNNRHTCALLAFTKR